MVQLLPQVKFETARDHSGPQDTIFSSKQKRLLVEALYSSWMPKYSEEDEAPFIFPRPYLAETSVGIFYSTRCPPITPAMFLSLDVQMGNEGLLQQWSPYLIWEAGKVPDAVIRIVASGDNDDRHAILRQDVRLPFTYSVIFDPLCKLSDARLSVYEIAPGRQYQLRDDFRLPTLSLSLTLWEGEYEGIYDTWLRWCDQNGQLIPTGKEGRAQETARADSAEAEVARLRAELAQLTARRRTRK